MQERNRVFRGGLTLCVALLVAAAGSAGAASKTTPIGATKAAPALEFQLPVAATPSVEVVKALPPALTRPAGLRDIRPSALSPELPAEVEPNDTPATATTTPFDTNNFVRLQGSFWPANDVDYYAFTAQAGDRVYAATMTAFAIGTAGTPAATLSVVASDGTTVIETDVDDGSFSALSGTVAGTTIPSDGTYYLRLVPPRATDTLRPYDLYAKLQRGTPTPEVESNDTPATANPLPTNGWVSGARNPAAATEQDWFSFTANAGDTVFLNLDTDPERDGVAWDGRLGIALFGDASNQILVVNDANAGSAADPPAEALFMTIKTTGTYFAFVDSANAATGSPTATYNLSVTVAPLRTPTPNCTTYTSTDVPRTIGPGGTLVSSTITVPGNPRIADVDVSITLSHAIMNQVDAHLRSPANNDVALFTDIGAAATGGQQQMDATFDDEAAIPPTFTALRNLALRPEAAYRLGWFDGEDAGGTWTLDLYDDFNDANGGTLTSWSLRICEAPPPPACPSGFAPQTVYSTDFESGAAGFTHAGVLDEWELGLPATVGTTGGIPVAAFNSCASGTSCWKTDLDNTYQAQSSQTLLSPAINLAGLTAPVVVSWSHRYQTESANFDHYWIDLAQVGGATPVRLFEWLDGSMGDAPGAVGTALPASAGWGRMSARADALAGLNTELSFHLDSDTSADYGGVAVDDVTVTACRLLAADLAITKTDGVTTATPGGSVTYTVTASNAGPDAVTGATVADTFPAVETCTWTCVGAGGGTCTAAGSGNISDSVNLPVGGNTTYTASCTINASATGTLSNTATVSSSTADPNPANNSATDTDTLTPSADLAITKADGTTSVIAGGNTTYTITASNAGPSNAPGATVADTFPASLTCTWTCVGAGGGTCTASGSGNISDTVNLPSGGSTTYTASCAVSGAASGSLSNTATVAAPGGVGDPNPGNNSATDTDTIQQPAAVTGTKTVTGTFTSGGTVTYTVTLNNSGGAQANNPGNEFVDPLPASLTLVSATATSGTASTAGNNMTWNGAIPAGGSVTITITATINAGTSGSVSNQGAISYDSNGDGSNDASTLTDDPGTGAPLDPTVFTVTPTVDLAITKTDGTTTVVAGGSTTYTLVVTNAGPNAAAGATVADTFPAGLTCTWTCAGADGGICTGSGSGNINDTVTVPVGATLTYTAACTIGASVTGTLANTALVAAPAGANQPNTANNSATDTDTVLVPAAVSGTKTVTGTFLPNGTVTYTIVLDNSGGAQGDNPGNEFSDVLPAALTLVSANATSGTAVASVATNTVSWNGPIAAGGSVTITITATVNATATGTISNQGTISYDSDANGTNDRNGVTDDPSTGVASDPTAFALGASADLVVTKTDGLTTVTAGTSSTYTITVGNLGPSAITGATIADTFPAECTAPTWTCAATGGGTCPPSGSGAIAATVDLPVSAIATFTATCPVGAPVPAGTVITNTATAAVPAGASDPDPSNNSATDTTTVTAAATASVSGTKVATGTFAAGGTVTYTIVLANTGSGTQGDNPGDEFTDVLPAQLTLVSATATSGTAVANAGTNTVGWNGAIAPAGSVTITISATINAGATGTVSNQGLIRFDNDGDGSNNAIVTTDDPRIGGAADSTDFVIGGPAQPAVPVPGLTPFGLAILAAGLAFAGVRRRRYG